MKNTVLSFIMLLATALGYSQESQLKLASDIWPPFTDEDTKKSFALDLVQLSLNRVGVSIDIEITDFKNVIEGIKNEEIDGSAAVWKSDEREEFMLFSDPYLHNQLILVGAKGSEVSQTSLLQLKNKKVGIVGNYAYGSDVEAAQDVIWTTGDSDQTNLDKLLQGELDYILVDALLIQYLLKYKKEEALQHIAIGEHTLLKKSLHLAIRKDIPDAKEIIDRFNIELIRMVADGSYNKVLHLNWIKADVDGDGTVEMVLDGTKAGSMPPENAYSVFFSNQDNATADTQYYIGGNFYQSWENIPNEYKVPKIQEEDLSKFGFANFRF